MKRVLHINAQDHEGWTPLHIAASWGYCLKELLSHRGLTRDILTDDGEGVDHLSPGVKDFRMSLRFSLSRQEPTG